MVVDTISQNKMLRQVSSRLHPQWWSKLDLEVLQSAREHNQLVSKRLDNVILSRSGCQSVWLSECSEEMNKWLSVLPRISLLATATGLLLQNCPDSCGIAAIEASYDRNLLKLK